MDAEILGISGSPVPNSNTDRLVLSILEQTGLDYEFIKLRDYVLEPCRACLGCVDSNECVVRDDGPQLAKKFRKARAFVIGAYTPYSSLDARTKTFIERMYCQRHQAGLNRGKIGAAVITTACPPGAPGLPPAAETATAQLAYWMLEEGIRNLGTVVILGNVPCIRCGHGDECEMSGVKMMHGPDASVQSVGVNRVEGQPDALQAARELATGLRLALEAAENALHGVG